MARNGAIWVIGEMWQIVVCPVTSVANFYFVLYLLGIFTTKKTRYDKIKSIKKNQIIKKFHMHRNAIRNVIQ